jgi:hypothetical protein
MDNQNIVIVSLFCLWIMVFIINLTTVLHVPQVPCDIHPIKERSLKQIVACFPMPHNSKCS